MPSTLTPPPRQLPLPELASYIETFDARCVAARWWAPRFHLRILADILGDASRWLRARSAVATAAEREDLAAIAVLHTALEDGVLNAADLPRIRTALRHIERSAALDARLAAQLDLAR